MVKCCCCIWGLRKEEEDVSLSGVVRDSSADCRPDSGDLTVGGACWWCRGFCSTCNIHKIHYFSSFWQPPRDQGIQLYSSMAPPWIPTYLGIVEYLVDPAVEVEHGGVGRRRRREAVDVREGEGGQGTL